MIASVTVTVAGLGCGLVEKDSPKFAELSATPFALPQGVTVEGDIVGAEGISCAEDQEVGMAAGLADMCVVLANETAQEVTVTLPPQITFVSDDEAFQNGGTLFATSFTVPGSGKRRVRVRTWCLNAERSPAQSSVLYRFGPVLDDPELAEIATLIEGKALDLTQAFTVQSAVWEVSDYGGLKDDDREALRKL